MSETNSKPCCIESPWFLSIFLSTQQTNLIVQSNDEEIKSDEQIDKEIDINTNIHINSDNVVEDIVDPINIDKEIVSDIDHTVLSTDKILVDSPIEPFSEEINENKSDNDNNVTVEELVINNDDSAFTEDKIIEESTSEVKVEDINPENNTNDSDKSTVDVTSTPEKQSNKELVEDVLSVTSSPVTSLNDTPTRSSKLQRKKSISFIPKLEFMSDLFEVKSNENINEEVQKNIYQQSGDSPSLLVGWQIEIIDPLNKESGIYVVAGYIKRLGFKTKFNLYNQKNSKFTDVNGIASEFECPDNWQMLKRKPKKPGYEFKILRKVAVNTAN